MGEGSHDTRLEFWEQYMEVERKELEQRRNGQLGRASLRKSWIRWPRKTSARPKRV